jgi:hypothetical protein
MRQWQRAARMVNIREEIIIPKANFLAILRAGVDEDSTLTARAIRSAAPQHKIGKKK